jgi:hypothetical protein
MGYRNPEKHLEDIRRQRREHYYRNRVYYIDRAKLRQKQEALWYHQTVRVKMSCCRCPEKDWRCIDWHHRNSRTKKFTISQAVRLGMARKSILKEISKCEPLCANCHRKEHMSLV